MNRQRNGGQKPGSANQDGNKRFVAGKVNPVVLDPHAKRKGELQKLSKAQLMLLVNSLESEN